MEVSTVSPPPASPTEGDDLCEMDDTDVAMHSVTLLMGLCGLVGNGAVFRLLTVRIATAGIFDLAVTDFLFLLFLVPSALLFLVEDLSCSLIMPPVYMRFLFHLSVVSYYWGLYQLTVDDLLTNMKKLCQLWWCSPPRRALWVLGAGHYWIFFVAITAIPTVTFLCQSHQQQHCQAALTSIFAVTLLLFPAPLVIVHTIDFIKAKCGYKKQQPKRRDVLIFLIVLLSLLLSFWNFLQQLGYMVVSRQLFFLLACIHSSIKPFIYFWAGRCWRPCSVGSLRESLQRVFEEQIDDTDISDDNDSISNDISNFSHDTNSLSNDSDSLNHDTDTGV